MKLLLVTMCCSVSLSAHAALKIQAWTLDNGARVLFVENHLLPILDLSVEFDAGSRRDPAQKSGTAALTNAMLARGVREVSAKPAPDSPTADTSARQEPALSEAQLSDMFADTGAEREESVDQDRAGMRLRTLSSPAERNASVHLLARILAHPAFPDALLARDRARMIAAIQEELTQPDAIASRTFWRLLYGRHPYAASPTPDSVNGISRDEILTFHQRHYVANRAVVSVIGDVTRAQADAIARQLTRRLAIGEPLHPLPAVPDAARASERIAHPATQSHVLIGAPALERSDPDYFPLMVGNYTLGSGGFVSRLMAEVREKRGLSYSAYSSFMPLAQAGPFEIGMQTQKERTDAALAVARDTLSTFLRSGPTAQELLGAKNNLIGGFALRIDTNRKILENVAMIGYYRLPLDYLDTWRDKVASVTVGQIVSAFQRKLHPDRLTTVVVGAGDAPVPDAESADVRAADPAQADRLPVPSPMGP